LNLLLRAGWQDQWQGFADHVACGMERTPLLDEPMGRA
jgi:hypothetical protein